MKNRRIESLIEIIAYLDDSALSFGPINSDAMQSEDGNRPWDFFLAHASGDKPIAEALYDRLAPHCRVFLDSRHVLLGDDWDRVITQAQRDSLVSVIMVSSNTERAYYQREEIAAAIGMARTANEAHRVVPLFLNHNSQVDTSVPYGLRLKQGLTLSDKFSLEEAAQELLSLLRHLKPNAPSAISNSEDFTAPEQTDLKMKPVPPSGNPYYYCYVSRDKIDQLFVDLHLTFDKHIDATGIVDEMRRLIATETPYGRADVFHNEAVEKRVYAQKLRAVLTAIAPQVVPFNWPSHSDLNSGLYWQFHGSFVVNDIDEDHLVASLVTKHRRSTLLLHCSLRHFSHLTIQSGKTSFQSTNYGFFLDRLPIIFDTVFVLLSKSGRSYFGSPLYLRLRAASGISL